MDTIRRSAVLATLVLATSAAAVPGQDHDVIIGRGFAPVNGARLFYEVRGKGEPVVLIHGGQLDSRMWDDQFDRFAKRYRVLRYDVRGYGGSRRGDRPYSDAEDLAALLDYVGMPKAHLVGLSLGGRIALDFTLFRPTRVTSLTLSGPGLAGFDTTFTEDDARMFVILMAARDEGPEKAAELWLRDPYMATAMEHARLAPRLRLLARENTHEWLANPFLQRSPRPPAAKRLAEIKAPTLLLIGGRDTRRSKGIVAALAKGIVGSKKVEFPKAGHMLNMEEPEAFNRAVLEFLRGGGGRSPQLQYRSSATPRDSDVHRRRDSETDAGTTVYASSDHRK
jgi:pimeloyl-ACP methyl ester carboxylesterase